MSTRRTRTIGSITIEKTVDITDPSYHKGSWLSLNDVHVVPGEYGCLYKTKDCSYTYNGKTYKDDRIALAMIFAKNRFDAPPRLTEFRHCIGSIGVDSGLAGFFADKKDYTDDEWDEFCDNLNKDAQMISNGFVTCSGYGDGTYKVFAIKDTDKHIIALMIRFL